MMDPGHFVLTKNAKELLATDYNKFVESYGTHFLIGKKMMC